MCDFDVLKAWDYAQTIFRSETLRIAFIKAEVGTRKHVFDVSNCNHTACMLPMYHGYVSWLCIMPMYHGYVSWLRILAMYHGYVSRLCILSQKVVPQGPFGQNIL